MGAIYPRRYCRQTCHDGLIFSSVWSWAIIFEKTFLFRRIDKAAETSNSNFGRETCCKTSIASSIRPDPMSGVFIAAMRESARGETEEPNNDNFDPTGGVA